MNEMRVPIGVRVIPLESHRDHRGTFAEIFRASWETSVAPVQWNATQSDAGVLRGVHVHIRHADYLVTLTGRATVGLRDLRRGSPTEGATALVDMSGDHPAALTIPPGVAHGFYYHERSVQIYAVSHYWDTTDELGCHWADPALNIQWPFTEATVSPRDAALPKLHAIAHELPTWSP